jgi:hypothetical protein
MIRIFGEFRRISAYEYVADHSIKMSSDHQSVNDKNREGIVCDDNGAVIGWIDTDGNLLITNGDKFPPRFVELVANEDGSRGLVLKDPYEDYEDPYKNKKYIAESADHPILAKHFNSFDVTLIVSFAAPEVLSALESVLSIPSFLLNADKLEPYNQFFVVTSLSGNTYLDFEIKLSGEDIVDKDIVGENLVARVDIDCDLDFIVRIDILTGESTMVWKYESDAPFNEDSPF